MQSRDCFTIFQKMIQKFHRNRNKPANEDIAELIFHIAEDKIQLSYHTEDLRIAASTREFLKPPNWDEKGAVLTFSSEMHQTFQVRRGKFPLSECFSHPYNEWTSVIYHTHSTTLIRYTMPIDRNCAAEKF